MRYDSAATDPAILYKLMAATIIPRPIAWVSSCDAAGHHNIAPFSFFNVMGHRPPILAIGINPDVRGMKDTARNIIETGCFVVNLVPESLCEEMNATAINAPHGTSEFDLTGLTPLPSDHIAAPRIAQSPVSFECVTHASMVTGPQQLLVVGRVLAVHIEDRYLLDPARGYVDTAAFGMLGRAGANGYIRTHDTFEMARPTWPPGEDFPRRG